MREPQAARPARWRRGGALALLVCGALASGCGDADSSAGDGSSTGEFSGDPLVAVTSKQGKLRVAAWTSPEQPPSRGTLRMRLLIEDVASDAGVEGLTLAMSPEMPSMGHGTPVVPKIASSGQGSYLASDVNLFMAGRWELRLTISGPTTDEAVIPVDVR